MGLRWAHLLSPRAEEPGLHSLKLQTPPLPQELPSISFPSFSPRFCWIQAFQLLAQSRLWHPLQLSLPAVAKLK